MSISTVFAFYAEGITFLRLVDTAQPFEAFASCLGFPLKRYQEIKKCAVTAEGRRQGRL